MQFFCFFRLIIVVEIIAFCLNTISFQCFGPHGPTWPRGGMVTQRIANPFIPVRFWTWPPLVRSY